MKKFALCLLVIVASAAYVWEQSGKASTEDPLGSARPEGDARVGGLRWPIPSTPRPEARFAAEFPSSAPHDPPPPTARAPVALTLRRPRLADQDPQVRVTLASMNVAADAGFSDGVHTGPAVDAYYGLVQVQAIVQGGRVVSIKMLQYPSDRRTSISINRRALPRLRDEAISAQSANVDIVSGATLTSEAFVRSLRVALGRQTTS